MSAMKCVAMAAGTALLAMAAHAGAATVLINENFDGTPAPHVLGASYGGASWLDASIDSGGVAGTKALDLTTTFVVGSQLWQGMFNTVNYNPDVTPKLAGYGVAAPAGATLPDFQYSFSAKGAAWDSTPNTPGDLAVQFNAYDGAGNLLGNLRKVFHLTAGTDTYQDFSGNLGEAGWSVPDAAEVAAAPSWNPLSSNALPTDAASYTVALVMNANMGGWTVPSSTNSTHLDNVTLSVVPEPASLGLAFLGIAGMGLRRRKR